jgi:ribosomal protein S18 acetylase RimI-like enzyme
VIPAPDTHQRALHADLVEALLGDPFVTLDLDPASVRRVLTVPGRAGAYVSRHPSRGTSWVTGLAAEPASADDIEAAVRLVVELAAISRAAGEQVTGVTISRGGRDLLPVDLRAEPAWEWDHWHTSHEPPEGSMRTAYGDGPAVVDLAADDPRLGRLLEVASPDAPLRPGDPRVGRWAGIEDPAGALPDTGGLAAVLAVTHQASGTAHLNDVATHPERRGQALARVLCGQVTIDALREGRPAVTLGMYADNDSARRVYTALGFTCRRGQTSGPIP